MAGAFGGVHSLTELPAFSSQHTRYALSAEDAKRDARLYDVLTKGLESYGANNKSSELRKKPTFFRRDRGASIIWDADDNIELLRRRLVDAGELKADEDEYLNHPVESVLARFLRAREGNTDEAYDQFMRMCAWRREEAVDRIVEEDFPEHAQLEALYPHYFMRTDRLQRPVSYVNLGGSDLDKILELMSPERFLRYDLLLRELAMRYHYPKLWGEYGTCIDQSVCIVDLKGFSLSQFSKQARELMTRAAHKDQEFYPEMLGKAFVINAPTTFRVVWAILKTLIGRRTQDKVTVCGKNFQKKLHAAIHPDNLPAFLGGTQREVKVDVFREYLEAARADLAANDGEGLETSPAASLIGSARPAAAPEPAEDAVAAGDTNGALERLVTAKDASEGLLMPPLQQMDTAECGAVPRSDVGSQSMVATPHGADAGEMTSSTAAPDSVASGSSVDPIIKPAHGRMVVLVGGVARHVLLATWHYALVSLLLSAFRLALSTWATSPETNAKAYDWRAIFV